jgi:hypothetical protein
MPSSRRGYVIGSVVTVLTDPLGLSRAQRIAGEMQTLAEDSLAGWDGKIFDDKKGRPYIVIKGQAVILSSSLADYYQEIDVEDSGN